MSNAVGATLRNEGVVTNSGSVENSGSFQVTETGSLTGAGIYTQTGGTSIFDGIVEQAQTLVEGGTLEGSGLIKGLLKAVGSGATLAPGNSPGTLTLDGDLEFDDSFLEIELESPALHDVLEITGEAIFDGGTVQYVFGSAPTPGDRFTFLTAAGGITGAETLAFEFLGDLGDLAFVTERNPNDLTLVAIPEPGTLWLVAPMLVVLAVRARSRVR
jgi:hypothetical protein